MTSLAMASHVPSPEFVADSPERIGRRGFGVRAWPECEEGEGLNSCCLAIPRRIISHPVFQFRTQEIKSIVGQAWTISELSLRQLKHLIAIPKSHSLGN